ncbi:MAG: uroporphyrinogen decarboxylase family protein [Promethearchaeota archaeon]
MNSRERVMATLNHTEPDKVPIDLGDNVTGIHIIAYRNLIDYLGIEDKNIRFSNFIGQTVIPCEELLEYFEIETRCLQPPLHSFSEAFTPMEIDKYQGIYDGFGVFWGDSAEKNLEDISYFSPVINPLSEMTTVQQIKEHPWPDGSDRRYLRGLREKAKKLRESTPYAIVGSRMQGDLFGYTTWLFGFEQTLRHLQRNPKLIIAAMEELERYWTDYTTSYLNEIKFDDNHYVDIVCLQGDLGTQTGPIINPKKYYEPIIKPIEHRYARKIHQLANVKINYHCCGSISMFIPYFIEMGYDAVNPIQISARDMEPCSLKQRFGSSITFWGGVCDTQQTLPFGTPDTIRKEVKYNMECLKPGGGFIASNIHNITAEVPPENIVAMFDAVRENRVYS